MIVARELALAEGYARFGDIPIESIPLPRRVVS
jgi:hypothetical protein